MVLRGLPPASEYTQSQVGWVCGQSYLYRLSLLTTVTHAAKAQQDKQSSFSFSAGEVGESLLFKWRIECIRLICISGKTWRKIWSICREAYKVWRSREVQYHLLHEFWCLAVNTPLHKWVDFFFHFYLKLFWATCCQALHLNAFLSWSSELVDVQPLMNSAKLGLTLEDNFHKFHFYSRLFCCQKGYSKHDTCIRIDPNPDQYNSFISAGWAGMHSWSLALGRAGSTLLLQCSSFIASSLRLINNPVEF